MRNRKQNSSISINDKSIIRTIKWDLKRQSPLLPTMLTITMFKYLLSFSLYFKCIKWDPSPTIKITNTTTTKSTPNNFRLLILLLILSHNQKICKLTNYLKILFNLSLQTQGPISNLSIVKLLIILSILRLSKFLCLLSILFEIFPCQSDISLHIHITIFNPTLNPSPIIK